MCIDIIFFEKHNQNIILQYYFNKKNKKNQQVHIYTLIETGQIKVVNSVSVGISFFQLE